MRAGVFPFLRATFYRWMQVWPEICPELLSAPETLSVGDLHVENFGTWRDIEGRLVWGINDFDEAFILPYTQDLVRLATSAFIAVQENLLAIHLKETCDSILDGYQKALEKGGCPYVLAENHPHLRAIAMSQTRDPAQFWGKFDSLVPVNAPSEVIQLLSSAFPKQGMDISIFHRTAGLGSLGRERFTAVANLWGAKAAREAKRLAVSACRWANPSQAGENILYQQIIDQSIHSSDPFTHEYQEWLVRRVAPDCSRIELADLPLVRDEARLLYAMGWETANIHLGSGGLAQERILEDLGKRADGWLFLSSEEMVKNIEKDWQVWKKVSE